MLKLRAVREARGLSLRDVERRTGIAAATLSKLERGIYPVYPGWRRRLVRLFGVPGDELFREAREEEGVRS